MEWVEILPRAGLKLQPRPLSAPKYPVQSALGAALKADAIGWVCAADSDEAGDGGAARSGGSFTDDEYPQARIRTRIVCLMCMRIVCMLCIMCMCTAAGASG